MYIEKTNKIQARVYVNILYINNMYLNMFNKNTGE